ncbi:MAG: hypothetical protein AAGI49_10865 [Bacteroidota bacterium]
MQGISEAFQRRNREKEQVKNLRLFVSHPLDITYTKYPTIYLPLKALLGEPIQSCI